MAAHLCSRLSGLVVQIVEKVPRKLWRELPATKAPEHKLHVSEACMRVWWCSRSLFADQLADLDVKLDLGLADVLLVGGVGSHFGSRIRSHTGRAPPSSPPPPAAANGQITTRLWLFRV